MIGTRISRRRPILAPITLWVRPIYWATGQRPSPGDSHHRATGYSRLISSMFDISPPTCRPATAVARRRVAMAKWVWPLTPHETTIPGPIVMGMTTPQTPTSRIIPSRQLPFRKIPPRTTSPWDIYHTGQSPLCNYYHYQLNKYP